LLLTYDLFIFHFVLHTYTTMKFQSAVLFIALAVAALESSVTAFTPSNSAVTTGRQRVRRQSDSVSSSSSSSSSSFRGGPLSVATNEIADDEVRPRKTREVRILHHPLFIGGTIVIYLVIFLFLARLNNFISNIDFFTNSAQQQ
jgi:hypothetical protein